MNLHNLIVILNYTIFYQYIMKGLCHVCHSSNVEIILQERKIICKKCAKV